jgi:queuosine precursor transporter
MALYDISPFALPSGKSFRPQARSCLQGFCRQDGACSIPLSPRVGSSSGPRQTECFITLGLRRPPTVEKRTTAASAENFWMDYMVTNSISLAASKKTAFAFLPVLTGLFTATLLISNVLNCKVIRVGPLPFTGGLIMFPLAALLGDVLTEVYGYAESRKVIWTGLSSLVLFVIMIEICGALPADSLWTHQAAYDVILGAVPRIVAASLTAYFVGEFSNSYVLAKCKVRTHGSFMFLRFVLSTLVGQFIDSATFVVVAFSGRMPPRQMVLMAFTGWAIMVVWEIAALPLTLPLVRALKRHEGVDYFDVGTNFNPLHF